MPEEVRSYLSSFHSILRVGSGNDPLVGIGHHAFREFLSDSSRSNEYCIDRHICHEEILVHCLDLLSDMAANGLPQISTTMRYACLYWASHLTSVASPDNSTLSLLGMFVRDQLLNWLSCMSRLEKLVHVDQILQDAEGWAMV